MKFGKIAVFALLGFCGLLAACVPSLNPLYTNDTIVFDQQLIGMWKEKPQEEGEWIFEKRETNSYTVTVRDGEGVSKFHGRLVKLGEAHFLDLFPDGELLNNTKLGGFYRASLIPGHLIVKVKVGSKLELSLMQPDWLENQLKANPKLLGHTYVEKDHIVITAATRELQDFISKHAESDGLWGEPGILMKMVL